MDVLKWGASESRSAVFFDRDGTLIEETHYLSRVSEIRILPQAVAAVKTANEADLLAVVVTNQSAVARGLLSEKQLHDLHDRIRRLFAEQQAHLDAFYYCPHHPDEGFAPYRKNCSCRKPQAGLLFAAAAEWTIDLSSSLMVGDTLNDVKAGRRAGCATVLVETGYGDKQAALLKSDPPTASGTMSVQPDFIASTVLEAVDWFLEQQP